MALMGASSGYIRFPLLVEGAVQGALGGAIALIAALAAYRAAAGPADAALAGTFEGARVSFLPAGQLMMVIVGGAVLGLVGSWLATRRHALV
jgi:cell division transport system permease protein